MRLAWDGKWRHENLVSVGRPAEEAAVWVCRTDGRTDCLPGQRCQLGTRRGLGRAGPARCLQGVPRSRRGRPPVPQARPAGNNLPVSLHPAGSTAASREQRPGLSHGWCRGWPAPAAPSRPALPLEPAAALLQ